MQSVKLEYTKDKNYVYIDETIVATFDNRFDALIEFVRVMKEQEAAE